jgi:hypothetical protein
MKALAERLGQVSGLPGGQTALGPAVGVAAVATAVLPIGGQGPGTGAPLPRTQVPASPVRPAEASGRRGKGGLIAAIIVGAVLLSGGGTVAWYFLLGPGRAPAPLPQLQPPVVQIAPPVIPPVIPPTVPVSGQGGQVVTTGAGALPPLPAIPTDDGSGAADTAKTGGKTGGKASTKPKGAACAFSGSQNTVAAAVLGNLKLGEGALKGCATGDGEYETVFAFQVPAGATELQGIRATKSAGMDSCLSRLLQRKLAASDPKAHSGKASFELTREKGVVTGCTVRVEVASGRISGKPVKPGPAPKKEDEETKKPGSKTGTFGIVKTP